MDEGNHMRSNQEHCGDCLPSGLQPFLVMEQSKRVKEFMQSYSMSGIIRKKGDQLIGTEADLLRCVFQWRYWQAQYV